MADKIERDRTVPDEMMGWRLDQAAAELFSEFSRQRLKQWINEQALLCDGAPAKPKSKVQGGESLTINAELAPQGDWTPEAIELDIRFEDDSVLVINKPSGLVVHPAAGNYDGTLLNALIHHCPSLTQLPRAGIVHRLDKLTTGLMVVAKTLQAQTSLVEQLQEKTVTREYDAIVNGPMIAGGHVDQPIGRHPKDRKRQAVVSAGKPAVTHYRVQERFRGHTHVRCRLETGRTHQIRVHMAHVHHPLVGDPVYGGRLKQVAGASEVLKETLRGFNRQALHARRLSFDHPDHGEPVTIEAELPDDMQILLHHLRTDTEEYAS
ncbi:23S rRNA pseudouridine(1911/1915/1917) synthase RluD [Larsenimonas suaedae]|uniref:Pseudouridine synthase n=1 Tax=Larsenimonas suaedae TaxID=1851019 RepID=A0ABU1H067_9GAMM|nr:23S rRNA pseudouridine(1911/1915/1917) synthase RluD [Larsenimonas suaedae]MCM2973714.1 23S rRNA pseudouridine(1911/1915/1917) synthase RluD [Larsenimonas suaedae]MDR5897152.1 23S rRNA pseudouridine(1911/1915/1917) synthase RluD [Larsenimonas suaedae]